MRVFLVLCVFLTAYAPAAQAQWLKNIFRVPAVSAKTLSVVERRALVGSYSVKVNRVVGLNRLNLSAERLPVLKSAAQTYYKTVAHRFPEVAVKPMDGARNTLEDMVLALPASLKPENVFIEKIPGIIKPTEVYLSAMFADAWANWLESGIGAQPPAELAVSRGDMKAAQSLQRDLAETFARQYAALPAEQKDLRGQLSRVLVLVQEQTGWSEAMMADLEKYFLGVMSSMLAKQNELSAREFLQAYDVLAVAAEVGLRYQSRLAKGASFLPHFLISESIQCVRRRLVEGFVPAQGSAREQRLKRWYEGLFGREKL